MTGGAEESTTMKKKKTLKKIPATAPPFVQIAVADSGLFALDKDGRVWGWSSGSFGWFLVPNRIAPK